MSAILIPIDDAAHAAAKAAARRAGLSLREFCRRAIVAGVDGVDDLHAMVSRIHAAIVEAPALPPEASAAVEALVQLGIPAEAARTRAAAIVAERPDLTADAIIAEALREG